jgi:hypothetical protein
VPASSAGPLDADSIQTDANISVKLLFVFQTRFRRLGPHLLAAERAAVQGRLKYTCVMATSCASAAPRLAAVLQGRSSKSFKGGRVAPKKDRATRRTGGGARVSRVFATSTDPKAAAESVDGDVIANNAASLDGKLRTLVVGVADERGDELLAHRNRDPSVLFRHQRWVDAYKVPGQYITITDVDSGKQITKQISVSPYHARSTAPNSDVSVIEILLDSGSDDGDENFFAAAQPPARLKVSPVRGGGFENPLFPEYNLKRAIKHGHSIVCIAGGTRGVGPLRSVMNWPDISSHAGAHPVTLFYLHAGDTETAGQCAAYVQEWDDWREAGAKVVPCYGEFFDDGVFQMQAAIAGSANGGGKFESVLGKDPSKVTVLMAGVSGEETKAVLNIFSTLQKVPKEQILVVSEFALKKGK